MSNKKLGRREFLKLMAGAAAGTALVACQPQIVKETVIVEKPVDKIVKETVIVEKSVDKIVQETVVVTEEKVVEKVVTATPAPVEKAELMFMFHTGGGGDGMEALWEKECLPRFNDSHPNIKVTYTPTGLPEKLIAAFVAGDAPDVLADCCANLPSYAERGQLLDLQAYMNADLTEDDVADWQANQLAYWHRTDSPIGQFALPATCQVLTVFYNMDMFDEAGVAYPPRRWKNAWDHDQYGETMRKLLKTDASGKVEHWGGQVEQWEGRIQAHVNSFGGHFVDPEDNTRCALGDPEAQAALWWLYDRTWVDGAYVPLGNLGDIAQWQTFEIEKTAMNEQGPWQVGYTGEAAEFRFNIAPFPKGPGGQQSTLASTDGFAAWSGTRFPDAAWELMKFVTSRYFGKVQARVFSWQPARKSVLMEWYGILRQSFPKLEDVDLEVFGDALTEGIARPDELFKKVGPSMELFYPAIEAVLVTGKETPDLFKQVAEEITKVNRET